MGLRHDLVALAGQPVRPRYGRRLHLAGADLPGPRRTRVPTRHGDVTCLTYDGTVDGTLLHLHGGAFVTRHPRMDDFWARFVVATTGVRVVLADYRVAPQVRYPVAHEQVYDVTATLAGQGPLVVGGFSAGGNLAAAAALWARDTGIALAGQLLAVPSVDIAEDVHDKCARAPGAMLSPALLNLVRATYFKDVGRRAEQGASPLRAASLADAAAALVVTAERDVLRAEGDAYAARLAAAAVPVEHVVAPAVDHYFLHGAGQDQARKLMTRMAQWTALRLAAAAG